MSRRRPRLGLASWIAISVVLGVATGLFFGETVAGLSIVGDVFIGLLQMTVLPYIVFALISNIGGLDLGLGRRLAVAAVSFLGLSYLCTLFAITIMPSVLPPLESASFFSTSLLADPESVDFVGLFVPANPFYALANNIVPAVVLFCVCLGAAVITIPDRADLLRMMNSITEALGRVNGFLVKLTPVGVFAIMASTAGTMRIEELQRLQVYLLIYTAATLMLGLVVLPGLLVSLSSFSYGQIMRALRVPLITAFATGKVFIVLPMLIEASERMFAESFGENEERTKSLRTVAPLIYPFPHAGKLMALLFIPFTAWFVDEPLNLTDYPVFLGAGLMSFFGSPLAGVPFLLDLHRLPSDMFQLFVISGVYAGRLGDALGAIHILFVSVLTTCALTGRLRWKPKQLLTFIGAATLLWAGLLGGTRSVLAEKIQESYATAAQIMDLGLVSSEIPTIVHRTPPPPRTELVGVPIHERVERTGVLRVGYSPNNLPLSFENSRGELVGLDVDMAYRLGAAMNCTVEFVPVMYPLFYRELDSARIDVMMNGVVPVPQFLSRAIYVEPHTRITAAVVVPDYQRQMVRESMKRRDFTGFRLAVPLFDENQPLFTELLPGAEFVAVEHLSEYFEGGNRRRRVSLGRGNGGALDPAAPGVQCGPGRAALSAADILCRGAGSGRVREHHGPVGGSRAHDGLLRTHLGALDPGPRRRSRGTPLEHPPGRPGLGGLIRRRRLDD